MKDSKGFFTYNDYLILNGFIMNRHGQTRLSSSEGAELTSVPSTSRLRTSHSY